MAMVMVCMYVKIRRHQHTRVHAHTWLWWSVVCVESCLPADADKLWDVVSATTRRSSLAWRRGILCTRALILLAHGARLVASLGDGS